jgi:hypothetical protein
MRRRPTSLQRSPLKLDDLLRLNQGLQQRGRGASNQQVVNFELAIRAQTICAHFISPSSVPKSLADLTRLRSAGRVRRGTVVVRLRWACMGVVPRPLTAVLQISSSWSQPLELTTNRKVGSLNLSVVRRAFTLGGRTHRERHKWTQSQHGNGVDDSLPSGSGNLDVTLGRQRLPFAHPLRDRDL